MHPFLFFTAVQKKKLILMPENIPHRFRLLSWAGTYRWAHHFPHWISFVWCRVQIFILFLLCEPVCFATPVPVVAFFRKHRLTPSCFLPVIFFLASCPFFKSPPDFVGVVLFWLVTLHGTWQIVMCFRVCFFHRSFSLECDLSVHCSLTLKGLLCCVAHCIQPPYPRCSWSTILHSALWHFFQRFLVSSCHGNGYQGQVVQLVTFGPLHVLGQSQTHRLFNDVKVWIFSCRSVEILLNKISNRDSH
jgi:hypothetical protein